MYFQTVLCATFLCFVFVTNVKSDISETTSNHMVGAPVEHQDYEGSEEFNNLLQRITEAYKEQLGKDVKIIGKSNYTTQVVSGSLSKLNVKLQTLDDGSIIECKVTVLSQPWINEKDTVTFIC